MALLKTVTTDAGFKVKFWKVEELRIDRSNARVNIMVAPWVSKAAYQNGKPFVKTAAKTIRVVDLEYPEGSGFESKLDYTEWFSPEALEGKEIYAQAYDYLKTVPFFSGAVDDIDGVEGSDDE